MWGRYCVCELLIAYSIDWLFAACLEYFIFSWIDSSQVRKQYDEYCLSIMQTITYAHDRTHFQCTTYTNIWSIICPFGGWFKRMELIEGKILIWALKRKLYIIYENVMWILGSSDSNPFIYFSTLLYILCICIPVISNDSNAILNYFHFVLLVVFF